MIDEPEPGAPQSPKEPSRIGKIFEPLPGIGMNREPDANRRTFLATAPNQNVKRGNRSRDKDLGQKFVGTI